MLAILSEGDAGLMDIAERVDLAKSTTHHHLRILRTAGLVRVNQRLLPLDANHQAVDAGANAQHGHPLVRLNETRLAGERHGHGQCHGTGVAQPVHRAEITLDVDPQGLEHRLTMARTDLMTDGALDLLTLPAGLTQKGLKRRHAGGDSLAHQRLRIGIH